MKLKVIAAIVMIAVGIGAVGFAVFGPSLTASGAPQYLTATASRGTVVVQAVATGTIGASATYGLAFGADPELATSGTSTGSGGNGALTWVTERVAVKVGDRVKAGQVLATADPTEAQAQLALAKANLAAAQARLSVDEGHASSTVIAAAQDAINQANLALTAAGHTKQVTIQQDQLAVTQAQQALANTQAQLATAEAGPTPEQLAVAQDSVNSAQLNLQTAQQAQANQVAKDQLAIQQAQQAVTNAQVNLANAQAKLQRDSQPVPVPSSSPVPPDPATIAADEAAITQAQEAVQAAQDNAASVQLNAQAAEQQAAAQVAAAQNALNAAQDNYKLNSAPSQTAITQAQGAVQVAQDNLTAAQQRLAAAQIQQGDSLAQAQQSLLSAEHNYAKSTGPATADLIAADRASVTSAQSVVATAQQTLDHATITAPVDGLVVAVNIQPGIVAPPGHAIEVQDSTLEAAASFAESSIASLNVGQPATVTVSAANATIDGTVSEIVPVGTSSGSNSVVTYTVVVSLANPPASVLAGMSASVAVTTAEAQNVVTVPAIAVLGSAGNYEVRVLDANGQVQVVPVQVGLMSSSLAEIQRGVSAGETVVVGTVSALDATTTGGGFGVGGFRGGLRGATSGGGRGGAGGGKGGAAGGRAQP